MPSLRILNISFECPLPYEPGQTMSASEAAELNKLRTERIGEQARAMIKAARAAQQADPTPDELALLARDFAFTLAAYAPPSDPQAREALKLGRAAVLARLTKEGKLGQVTTEDFAAMVAEAAAHPAIVAEAARRTLAIQEVAEAALLGLEGDLAEELGL